MSGKHCLETLTVAYPVAEEVGRSGLWAPNPGGGGGGLGAYQGKTQCTWLKSSAPHSVGCKLRHVRTTVNLSILFNWPFF